MINGNMVGGTSPIKTLILTDKNGNEIVGTVVESLTVFDANPTTDIREGKVAVTDKGVVTGSAIIPNYETYTGKKSILAGKELKITLANGMYDYTEMQCVICPFNSSINNSVAVEKAVIEDNVYKANSTDIISTVIKNESNSSIDFNLTNTSDVPYIIRFFLYRELY